MDPMTRAATDFLTECETFWRRKHGRVLPMIAHYSQRKNLVGALRLHEHAPENRRPLFLWDAPFEDSDSYFDGLRMAVEKQYDLIREGVAEEGVTLAALAMGNLEDLPMLTPMHRAALCIRRVAALLTDLLEGVLVALVPEQFADRDMWRNSVEAWMSLPWPDNVRLAVFDAPGGPLGGILGRKGAHLVVDEGILNHYVRNLCPPKRDSGKGGNGGNGAPPPAFAGNGVNGACANGTHTLVLHEPPAIDGGSNGVRTLVLHNQPESGGTNGVRTLVLHDPAAVDGSSNGVHTLVLCEPPAIDGSGGHLDACAKPRADSWHEPPAIDRGCGRGVRTAVLQDPPIAGGLPFAGNDSPAPVMQGPALETGRKLRALMVDAALKSREGEHFAAAQLLQQARTLCQAEGLTLHEAIVTVALAGACLAAGQTDLAVKAFAIAADLGHHSGDWTIAAQAWLGAGVAYTMQKKHELAARAYENAGGAAEAARSPLFQLEALRLLGACHLAAGAEDKAAMAWRAAVRLGAAQRPEVRKASTVRQTVRALGDLLTGRGLRAQAAQVAALADS